MAKKFKIIMTEALSLYIWGCNILNEKLETSWLIINNIKHYLNILIKNIKLSLNDLAVLNFNDEALQR